MQVTPTKILDVWLIEPQLHGDERGFFMEAWNQHTFEADGLRANFVQDNHSRSIKGTLRGLHYQNPVPQTKLVRVVRGAVFDVAVDLRQSSPTFGKWIGTKLSEDNHRMLWMPEGIAHGFYVLSDYADFVYKCANPYRPEYEHTLFWNDRDVAIQWPAEAETNRIISPKDQNGTPFKEAVLFD